MSVYPFIEAEKVSERNVSKACALLSVSRSAYSDWHQHVPSTRALSDAELGDAIAKIHGASRRTYGAPRITAALRRGGILVGKKRVARLMVHRGLVGRGKRRSTKTTIPDPSAQVSTLDRLGRAFAPETWALDSVYVGDITYIRTHEGWLYLATMIDLASRRVVGFAMADHMRASLVCDALAMAIELRHPAPGLVVHTDRGSQYTSREFQALLDANGLSNRSRDPASAGTMRSPRASSPRSRRSSSTARRSRPGQPRAERSSSSSRSSTTAAGCTPRSATAHRPSTKRSGGSPARLRRHSQAVRRTGARPSPPDARRADPDRRRPDRLLVRVREGRREVRRRRRFRRRLEAGLLRLGVQGQAQGPQGRLPPARRLQGRAREPAAPRRLRSRSDRGPHQLHRPLAGRPTRSPSTTSRRPTRPSRSRSCAPSSPNPRRCARRHAPAQITETAARHFAELAVALHARGHEPQAVAHFLDKLLFCLFAEDAGTAAQGPPLPAGRRRPARSPTTSARPSASSSRGWPSGGGMFGAERIHWFNGGLFDSADVLRLTSARDRDARRGRPLDWGRIEPAIFGTLFERGLDPEQRAQLGAHYTSRERHLAARRAGRHPARSGASTPRCRPGHASSLLRREACRKKGPIRGDPRRSSRPSWIACGPSASSTPPAARGNFLYIALQALKDLECEAIQLGLARPADAAAVPAASAPRPSWASRSTPMPPSSPGSRSGSARSSGCSTTASPTAATRSSSRSTTSRRATRCSTSRTRRNPREADWPAAEFIVGNPPFLGAKLLRRGLGDDYVETLFGGLRRSPAAHVPTSSPTGTRRRGPRSPRARRVAPACSRRRASGRASRRVLERINGDRRHLLRPVRRAVGPGRGERPHQLRRPGRRLRDGARA